ncbi:MAG: HypC/HybG/HupF family hydrogenase formation chaperone [Candidatus Limnocylindrales bacterium]
MVMVVGDEADVEVDGRTRRLPALLVPDLRPGDHVLIGLGTILARLDTPSPLLEMAPATDRRT